MCVWVKVNLLKDFFWESVGIGNTNYLHGNLTKLKRILSKYKDECDLSQIIKILENKKED